MKKFYFTLLPLFIFLALNYTTLSTNSYKSEVFRANEYKSYLELIKPKYIKISEVHVTMYHPVEGQTDDTPDIVADGTWFDINRASELKWVAVSRDLLDRWGGPLSFGDIVYIKIGDNKDKTGFYRVKDTMNQRWSKRIDILESPGYPLYRHPSASLYLVYKENILREDLWALQKQDKLLPL